MAYAAIAGASLSPGRGFASAISNPAAIALERAKATLERVGARVPEHDVAAVIDFSLASRYPRFHLLNLVDGNIATLLVAHGRGSDPAHSGWLQRFSNLPGSEATSNGAYLTGPSYIGKHGLSRRLIGLDSDNDQAESRAIVIHAADYVGASIIRQQGKLGRSQGCFALQPGDLPRIMEQLGPGRLLLAHR